MVISPNAWIILTFLTLLKMLQDYINNEDEVTAARKIGKMTQVMASFQRGGYGINVERIAAMVRITRRFSEDVEDEEGDEIPGEYYEDRDFNLPEFRRGHKKALLRRFHLRQFVIISILQLGGMCRNADRLQKKFY